jgi:hypothetical protein
MGRVSPESKAVIGKAGVWDSLSTSPSASVLDLAIVGSHV